MNNGQDDLDFFRPHAEHFRNAESISIDHAVMEHTMIGAVVSVEIDWSDVGTWTALWERLAKDAAGNATRGAVYNLETAGCYLRSEGPLLAAIGVEDLIVIADTDAVLVARRADAQRVKDMFEFLSKAKRPEVSLRPTVFRPWGSYTPIDRGDEFQVKRIVVNPHGKLSLQKHRHRAEHWVIVRGEALVTRGEKTFRLSANQSTYIPLGEVHRLENDTTEPLHLIEVQTGTYLGEDDIVRLEDNYGRKEEDLPS
jgi:mannose-1-phosphate guanylyltransferase/mannose-6-phosphate isomerase